uniref:Uncharacterized protein MANES_10G110000 n=1 Tax=Rhizophora mucronata TaxID=61149 RepID=A0A2P2JMG4_RHIMU
MPNTMMLFYWSLYQLLRHQRFHHPKPSELQRNMMQKALEQLALLVKLIK